MLNRSLRCFLFLFWCVVNGVSSDGIANGQDGSPAKAATVTEARAALELADVVIVESVGEPETGVAFQRFNAAGNPSDVAKKIDLELKKRGLEPLDGAMFSDAYCAAQYKKTGFVFSLTTMPADKANVTTVSLLNLGNVELNKLPKPAGSESLYVLPGSAMFVCDLSVVDANQQCRQLLEADGWQWFGETTVTFFMRQNAVRLQVMCSTSPGQSNRTAIQFSTEQMSSSLPIIADLVRIDYSDSTMRLGGDSRLAEEPFLAMYRKLLESEGWQATTDQPIKIDFRRHLIFRNESSELAELAFSPFESLTRFDLKFMSAAQVEKENKQAKLMAAAAIQKRKAEQAKLENPVVLSIDRPEAATAKQAGGQSVDFSVRSGTARSVMTKWLESRKTEGWTVKATVDTREVGQVTLTHGDQTLDLSWVDPGFIAGEISIRTSAAYRLQVRK